ncbi:MAG: glycosyltransferase family 4 protein [Candidatus Omnitrophica bacterium]|nr:glycosyltransferase family 4 protein [Candidatus Omnitrophota bacterium]
MRILYITTAAAFGGATKHVVHLMRYFAAKGCRVGLVAGPEPRLMQAAKVIGAKVFPEPHFIYPISPYHDLRALISVWRAIKFFKPDIISSHSTKAGLAARLSAAWERKPVIFTAHGWSFGEGRSFGKRWFLSWLERLAAKSTVKIICVSEYDYRLALKFRIAPPNKLAIIHNGIDPAPIGEADRMKIRKELKLEKATVITFVGRLNPQKDLSTLIKAAKLIAKAKIIIVGDGPLRQQVQGMIGKSNLADRVVLVGEQKRVEEFLVASDIFVLSSNWEGLPRSIIEAMLAKLPVVATDVGGVSELVKNSVTGFLVPPRDPAALAGALEKLIEDKKLRKDMGEAGYQRALRKFSLDRMLVESQQVYEEILKCRL